MSSPAGRHLLPVEVRTAPPDPPPPARPPTVRAAVAAMVLGAVLAVADAVVKLLAWDRGDLERRMDAAGVTPGSIDGLFTTVRVVGLVGGLVVTGLWLLHARATDRGRSWARPWATALAGVFVLANVINLAGADSAPGAAYLVVRAAVAVVAVVLLWLPASTAFLRSAPQPMR